MQRHCDGGDYRRTKRCTNCPGRIVALSVARQTATNLRDRRRCVCECVREVSGCVGGVLKCLLLTHLQRKAEIPTRLDRVVVHRVGIQVQTSALTPDLPRFGHMLHGLAEHGHLSNVALLAPHLHQDLRHDGGNDDR